MIFIASGGASGSVGGGGVGGGGVGDVGMGDGDVGDGGMSGGRSGGSVGGGGGRHADYIPQGLDAIPGQTAFLHSAKVDE